MSKEHIEVKITQFLNEVGFTKHFRGDEEWDNQELAHAMALHLFKNINDIT